MPVELLYRRRQYRREAKGVRLFIGYIGIFLIFIGLILLAPLLMLCFYHDETYVWSYFVAPACSSIALGILLYASIFRRRKARLQKWQSYILLITIWMLTILIASFPFLSTGEYSFTEAIFEATSGFTTTSIVMSNHLPGQTHVFLFYRCWMLFVGGIGLTLILTSAISDANGLSLYSLEGHNDRLLPNLVKSSRIVFIIYSIFIVLGMGGYLLCGMPLFDAFCTSISAISTGGYLVSKEMALDTYANPIAVQAVTAILMLLGSTNFMIHFRILRGKFKTFFYHSELYCFLIVAVICVPLYASAFTTLNNGDISVGIGHGVFYFISTITSSGFVLKDVLSTPSVYTALPSYLFIVAVFCMVMGGQAGSTSGGVKQMRVVMIIKQVYWDIRATVDNKHVIPTHTIVRYGKKENIDPVETKNATAFLLIYLASILLGSFAFTCFGEEFDNALFEATGLISTTGYTSGILSLTSPPGVMWIAIILMIVGRLEPIIFINLIAKGSKTLHTKINDKITANQLQKNN
ncbi:MAG: hypothetical protein MJ206_00465 [Bacilli bacterium]|nr:hypothetical protein [Bacilli bacterium]